MPMPTNPSQIIKDGQIVENDWQLIEAAEEGTTAVPAGKVIVPMSVWQEQKADLTGRGDLGVWLDSADEPEAIADELANFEVIAINFPAFTDGRGYSYARLLRERFNYAGEIRAIGDVFQDMLHYQNRCGFNAFALKEGKDINKALAGLKTIGESYQPAVDEPQPLFRRRG